MDFWDRVKKAIKDQNTTQEWISKEAGISWSTFKGWIAKDRLPNVIQAVSIARVLNESVEYLATGERIGDQWVVVNADFIRDCKALDSDQLSFTKIQVHALAECNRLKKSQSTAGTETS